MNDLNEREEGIFNEARQYSDPKRQSAYLAIACQGDLALEQRIKRLLHAGVEATNFFGQSAADEIDGLLTEAAAPLTERPGSAVGRYKILQQIGEGGMGAVFMAEQTEPIARKVALKIIKLGMDTRHVVARFEAERQALAMMEHPHIARVLDAGATDSGRPYFVMELVAGVPITEYCDKNKLSTEERLALFMPVCQAIQHAHQKGIIHRDIKPANVLITLHDGRPVPKVIDFGIAKATNQRLTEKTLFTNHGQMIGTPAYMSPEQAEMSGLDIDTRTDVYSLGVLLYELLTGTTPFPAKELMSLGYGEIQKVISEQDPPKPSTRLSTMQQAPRTVVARNRSMDAADVGKTVRGDLDWIVMKALEKDRSRRYETVNGLVADVERHLNDEPVTAAAPTFAYQFQKFYRRNRAYLRVAAMVAGLLVLATVFSLYQAALATSQKNFAREALQGEREALEAAQSQGRQLQLQQYVSYMRLAQAKLDDENLGEVRNLLERHRPDPGAIDLRGWEWQWFWQESRGNAVFCLSAETGTINALSASHDGQWIAFLNRNDGIEIWDLWHQKEVFFDPPGFEVLGIRFSPTDPEFAVLCRPHQSTEGTEIQIWKKSTMTLDRTWSVPQGRRNTAIQYSGDGQYLVGKSEQGMPIDVWETATGTMRPVSVIGFKRDSNVDWAVNSDASRIAQGDEEMVVVSDLISGEEVWRQAATEDVVISALAFSPNNQTLASGHGFADGAIRTWDAITGEPKDRWGGHLHGVSDIQFSPDGKILYSAGFDQTVRVWSLESLELQGILRGQGSGVRRIALIPGTGHLAGGGKGVGVSVWNLDDGGNGLRDSVRPKDIRAYRFHESGERVWTVNGSGVIREFETSTLNRTGFSCDLQHEVEFAAFSYDGSQLAAGTKRGLMVWTVSSDKDPLLISLPGQVLMPVGFTDDNRNLVFMQGIDKDHQAIVEWDLAKNEKKRSWPLVKGTANANKRGWRMTYRLYDGGAAMIGPHDGGLQQIDLVKGRAISLPHLTAELDWPSYDYEDWSLSPDRRYVAAASGGQSGTLFRSKNGFAGKGIQKLPIKGFSLGVHGVAFAPDGKRLALGSVGREAIKLWHMDAQEHILTLPGVGTGFSDISFSPDGNCLAATTVDGVFHVWRAPSWEAIADAEAKEEKRVGR